ncbi:hypothetical protein [Zongyangia hominis]|uniref:Uncharacterized protein n=1 Tax=Zongyangia hominis TaxID=2763677 RepID=A0A926E9M4_9FIRM|nr:hypothetical protein [Zongyangia hominis]MBC8569872.1 hypothetical protein [Zongyangia hominis]
MTEIELQKKIQSVIVQVADKEMGMDTHLLSDKAGISMEDFLYVFRELREELQCPVSKSLEHRNYMVFTIRGLADAFLEDWPELHEFPG